MPVLTKINTNAIADDAVTGDKFSGASYIPNSTSQDISGTYSENRLYTSDAYTLSGNATVNSTISLSTVKSNGDVVLTAGGAYTLTGTGTLEGGSISGKTNTDASQLTGTLQSPVTGSPNLNLGNATFPAGHVVQVVSSGYNGGAAGTSTTSTSFARLLNAVSASYQQQITITSGNKVFIHITFAIDIYGTPVGNNIGGGFGIGWNNGSADAVLVDSGSNDTFFQDNDGTGYKALYQNFSLTFLHTPNVINPTYYLGGETRNTNNSCRVGEKGANITLMEIKT